MGLEQFLGTLRRYWRSIVAVSLVVAGIGIGLLMLQRPTYTAISTVHFLPQASGSAGQLAASLEYAAGQAKAFGELADTPAVLDPVGAKLVPPASSAQLAGQVSIWGPGETASLKVNANDADPQRAADVANAVADQILASYREFNPEVAGSVVEVRVTQRATPPSSPSSPDFLRNLAVALGIGLGAGVGQAFLRSYLDNRVESMEDVAKVTKHRVIGEIPFDKDENQGSGTKRSLDSFSVRSEAYRRLRTNLQFLALEGGAQSMLVTSSVPGEGKTVTVSSLARALAEAGQKVLLIDADLRRPQVANYLGLENNVGLTSVLLGQAELGDLVSHVEGVDVLPSGPIPPNPSELLGSNRMKALLADALKSYDAVLIDTPPLLPVTDAAALSKLVGGSLVVVDTEKATRNQLRHALRNLDQVQAPVLGVILNKIATGSGRYGYGYGYSYRYDYATKGSGKKATRGHKSSKDRSSGSGHRESRGSN